MNHKWANDTCLACGATRIKKTNRKLVRTYSKLINGIWEDIPVHRENFEWYYNNRTFVRPDCVTKRDYDKWLIQVKKEQKHYPLFRGLELCELNLKGLFDAGKTPIDALNDLSTLT